MIIGQMIHRELFWKAGLSFYQSNAAGSIANPILRLLSKFFAPYIPYYHRIFDVMFPDMYKIVFYGLVLIVLYLFIPWIRNKDEDFINIYSSSSGKYSIKFPFNLFFLYFLFFSNTIFNGFGYMTTQQRYIYQVHPFFIAIYCYVIFDIGRLLVLGVSLLFKNIKSQEHGTRKENFYLSINKSIYIIVAVLIIIFTVNWANPVYNFKIVFRNNGDAVVSEFAPSNTFSFHHDAKTPGEYIFKNKKAGDIVIATDLLNPYGYTGQIDYWLWTGGFSQWQPYVYKDGKMYDEFFGVPLIRDLYQLYMVLNNNADKNIWLITSNSMRVQTHISPDVAEFIYGQKQNLKATGKDGVCQAYLFEKTDKQTRGYFFIPENKNIIELQPVDFPTIIGFGNKDNKDFFKYGWSQVEPRGTWADKLYSVLFLKFNERLDYKITLNVLSLDDPKQPQEMEVIFNNNVIGKIQFKDSKPVEAVLDIPAEIVNTEAGSYNILKFNYKYLLSPLNLGVSSDTRTLAVFFQRIAIEKK